MDLPSTEPLTIRAGDTVTWQRILDEYPASAGWTLQYRLLYASGAPAASWSSTGSGSAHTISLASSVTAAFTSGEATLCPYVERTVNSVLERQSLGTLPITVLPDLTQVASVDSRSSAQRILADLRAALEGYLASANATIVEYTIGDRTMRFRSSEDILAMINYYDGIVRAELRAQARAVLPRVLYRG